MRCPSLSELPPAPANKTGWPWTEESLSLPDKTPDGFLWPRITVVTPSFNQGQFLEEAIRSVLLQGYPNIEYFLFDGGSTDNSVEIIRKYSSWLTYWVSEPDSGQSDVINRGLEMGSGLYATWINSDDMLCENALYEHGSRIGFADETVYVGICIYIDEIGRFTSFHRARVYSLEDLLRIREVWRSKGHIVQPEVLFPRELALSVGGLNHNLYYCMDYELWGKLLLKCVKFQYTEIPMGTFRQHKNQKTADGWENTQVLINVATKLVTHAEGLSEKTKRNILEELIAYRKDYWRSSGDLAKIGLPPTIVIPIRNLKMRLRKTHLGFLAATLKNNVKHAILNSG